MQYKYLLYLVFITLFACEHHSQNINIKNSEKLNDLDNLKAAIVTPDYDIIPDAQKLTPAYLVFDNYELILKWNRSLRFALAVCTLKKKFKNAI